MLSVSSISLWSPFSLAFRRENSGNSSKPGTDQSNVTGYLSGIRCPLGKWRPARTSLWTCWDVHYPEYFSQGCGTDWNTFETRGVCPTCSHQWKWTTCHSCHGWSLHEDWYT